MYKGVKQAYSHTLPPYRKKPYVCCTYMYKHFITVCLHASPMGGRCMYKGWIQWKQDACTESHWMDQSYWDKVLYKGVNPMWTKLELCVLIVLEPTINESELNMHNKGMLRTIACIQQCICLLKSDHITGKKFVFRYWEFHEIPINGNVEHVLSWEFRMGISFHLGFCVGFSGKPELVGPKLQ